MNAHHSHHHATAPGGSHVATDPVCDMKVDPASAAGSVEHDGATYYFCSGHCVERFKADPQKYLNKKASTGAASAQVTDPVCGMSIHPMFAAGSSVHDGETYHFCSKHCLEQFKSEPQKYVRKDAAPPTPAGPKDAQYTCPMHPEIVQIG